MRDRRKRKILIVTQYFWPEQMRINDLVRGLVEDGCEIYVLTGKPNYPEGKIFDSFRDNPELYRDYYGAKVFRVPMIPRGSSGITLAMNYASFALSGAVFGWKWFRRHSFDGIFVFAVSPITSAIPAIVIGKATNSKVLTWVLDLWPDTLSALGVVKNRIVLSLVERLVRWIYRSSDMILVQSKGFYEKIEKVAPGSLVSGRVVYFPSWADDIFSGAVETKSNIIKEKSKFNIVFAGNIGESQDVLKIVDAAASTAHCCDIRWIMVGSGRQVDAVKCKIEALGLENIELIPTQPLEEMPSLFKSADVLLVTLRAGDVFAATIPGKLQAYMAMARPVLGMIDGEAKRIIDESKCGLCVPGGDSAGLAEAAIRLYRTSSNKRSQMGERALDYYSRNFDRKSMISKLLSLCD